MKLREVAQLLGWRSEAVRYGHHIRTFDLPRDGRVQYAQWLHPGETDKHVSQAVVDELRTFIRPGDVAIDIGAHSGDSTLPMALAAGPTGMVIALEPNPFVYPVLEANAGLNRDKAVILPLNMAATAASGTYRFEYSDAGFCNGGRHQGISKWRHGHAFTLDVHGEPLPAFLDANYPALVPRIRYVKVDAEGYDLEVLRSLEPIITRCRPYLRAEVFKLSRRAQRESLLAFLAGHGYQTFRIESDERYRGEPVTPANLMTWRHFDVFATPTGAPATT